jgi:hypothetical protein
MKREPVVRRMSPPWACAKNMYAAPPGTSVSVRIDLDMLETEGT